MRSAKGRSAAGAAVCRFVEALDQITRLLEFDRKKVSRRDIDPFQFNAGCVTATGNNFVRPELQARSIRLAVEKVQVVLVDKPARVVDWIARGRQCCRFGDRLRRLPITHRIERDGVEAVGLAGAAIEDAGSGRRAELPEGVRAAVL